MDPQLLNRVTQQLKLAASASVTPAGQTESAPNSKEQIHAINQIFELFRFNYNNQFLKAFPDHDTLLMGKRLWARLLSQYSAEILMRAAEKAVKESAFLPNVHEIIKRCEQDDALNLPSAYAAFIEACRAPSPKASYAWSHPIIYYAGAASDWFFLANNSEDKTFPVFERNYDILKKRLARGEEITLTIPQALPEKVEVYLPKEENIKKIQAIIKGL